MINILLLVLHPVYNEKGISIKTGIYISYLREDITSLYYTFNLDGGYIYPATRRSLGLGVYLSAHLSYPSYLSRFYETLHLLFVRNRYIDLGLNIEFSLLNFSKIEFIVGKPLKKNILYCYLGIGEKFYYLDNARYPGSFFLTGVEIIRLINVYAQLSQRYDDLLLKSESHIEIVFGLSIKFPRTKITKRR